MLLNKRFATTSLASLVILSGAGYSLVLAEEAEKPFEISTNQRDQTEDKGHSDFDSPYIPVFISTYSRGIDTGHSILQAL